MELCAGENYSVCRKNKEKIRRGSGKKAFLISIFYCNLHSSVVLTGEKILQKPKQMHVVSNLFTNENTILLLGHRRPESGLPVFQANISQQ